MIHANGQMDMNRYNQTQTGNEEEERTRSNRVPGGTRTCPFT